MTNSQKIAERTAIYIKTGFKLFEHDVDMIAIYIREDLLRVDYFYGSKKTPVKVRYTSLQDMMIKIDDNIKTQYDKNTVKKANMVKWKEQTDQHRANIKVGDIFRTSWGYGQTNVDFFQVVGRPTNAKALIRQIGQEFIGERQFMSGQVKARKNDFIEHEDFAKLVIINSSGNLSNADRYENHAYPTTEDATHFTSWDH
jgi:hypothetical protein